MRDKRDIVCNLVDGWNELDRMKQEIGHVVGLLRSGVHCGRWVDRERGHFPIEKTFTDDACVWTVSARQMEGRCWAAVVCHTSPVPSPHDSRLMYSSGTGEDQTIPLEFISRVRASLPRFVEWFYAVFPESLEYVQPLLDVVRATEKST